MPRKPDREYFSNKKGKSYKTVSVTQEASDILDELHRLSGRKKYLIIDDAFRRYAELYGVKDGKYKRTVIDTSIIESGNHECVVTDGED
jgi:hypothetical protein